MVDHPAAIGRRTLDLCHRHAIDHTAQGATRAADLEARVTAADTALIDMLAAAPFALTVEDTIVRFVHIAHVAHILDGRA